jgi:hypothetical protein
MVFIDLKKFLKDIVHSEKKHTETVFLMASVHSGSKMYRTSAAPEIHAAVHFVRKVECIKYTL